MKNGKAYPMECGVWDGVSLLSGFGEVEFLAISENVFVEIAWLVGPNGGLQRGG